MALQGWEALWRTAIIGAKWPRIWLLQFINFEKNKEAKLFYVLTTMDKEAIADKINEYWEHSTSVGYDFDE